MELTCSRLRNRSQAEMALARNGLPRSDALASLSSSAARLTPPSRPLPHRHIAAGQAWQPIRQAVDPSRLSNLTNPSLPGLRLSLLGTRRDQMSSSPRLRSRRLHFSPGIDIAPMQALSSSSLESPNERSRSSKNNLTPISFRYHYILSFLWHRFNMLPLAGCTSTGPPPLLALSLSAVSLQHASRKHPSMTESPPGNAVFSSSQFVHSSIRADLASRLRQPD